jgi:hypothetical protein
MEVTDDRWSAISAKLITALYGKKVEFFNVKPGGT